VYGTIFVSKTRTDKAIRIFDVVLAGILIILFLPIMALTGLAVLIFIGSPPLYVSTRSGLNGKPFRHCKFRTMLPGLETGRVFFEQDRINWCGKILRTLHIDELPELFHIAAGTMSFVGPRPLPPAQLESLDTDYRERVLPGWTGTAQVCLLKHGLLNKHLQIRLDNHYAIYRSLRYNLRILCATFYYALFGRSTDLSPRATADRIEYEKRIRRVGDRQHDDSC
jgi:lipopolysaccharide/colanic/teichoic acid biosynthesis glycosyltransferase